MTWWKQYKTNVLTIYNRLKYKILHTLKYRYTNMFYVYYVSYDLFKIMIPYTSTVLKQPLCVASAGYWWGDDGSLNGVKLSRRVIKNDITNPFGQAIGMFTTMLLTGRWRPEIHHFRTLANISYG